MRRSGFYIKNGRDMRVDHEHLITNFTLVLIIIACEIYKIKVISHTLSSRAREMKQNSCIEERYIALSLSFFQHMNFVVHRPE